MPIQIHQTLKNTYGEIKVRLNEKEINSGRMFLGLLCGDHTKSAINTAFTTGSVAGICANLVSEGYLPAFIQSFSWGGKADSKIFQIEKCLEITRTVMARRNKDLLPEEEKLLIQEYNKVNEKYYNLVL